MSLKKFNEFIFEKEEKTYSFEELPEESVVGHARDLGNITVWWNRLLYELSSQE